MGYLTVPVPAQFIIVLLSLALVPACAGPDPPTGSVRAAQASVTALDLNTATAEELGRLPGIGPATAGKIVAHRREHGRFSRVEHLLLVDGISETRFRKLRPYLTVR